MEFSLWTLHHIVYFCAMLITVTDTKCGLVSGANLAMIFILDRLVIMIRLISVLFGNFDLIHVGDILDVKYI